VLAVSARTIYRYLKNYALLGIGFLSHGNGDIAESCGLKEKV
jgi:hypothetical protein